MRVEFTITGTYDIDEQELDECAMRTSAEVLADDNLSDALGDYSPGIRINDIVVRATS